METVFALAKSQHGLVSRTQCLDLGVSGDAIWRLLKRGTLERVLPEVYRIAGVPPSWHQDLLAAALWSGDGVVSHRAAAALWELRGYGPGRLEITTTKRNRAVPGLEVHRRCPDRRFIIRREGMPVTNAALTLIDLAAVENVADRLERALDDALRRRLTTARHLLWALDVTKGPGHRGPGTIQRLLGLRGYGGPSASDFQKEVRRLLRDVGDFQEEYEIFDAGGTFVARVDFFNPEHRVVVEADGHRDHSGRLDRVHDLHRRNGLTALGLQVFHVTPDDLPCPGAVLGQVRDALGPPVSR